VVDTLPPLLLTVGEVTYRLRYQGTVASVQINLFTKELDLS